jgi:hypothetical protein
MYQPLLNSSPHVIVRNPRMTCACQARSKFDDLHDRLLVRLEGRRRLDESGERRARSASSPRRLSPLPHLRRVTRHGSLLDRGGHRRGPAAGMLS